MTVEVLEGDGGAETEVRLDGVEAVRAPGSVGVSYTLLTQYPSFDEYEADPRPLQLVRGGFLVGTFKVVTCFEVAQTATLREQTELIGFDGVRFQSRSRRCCYADGICTIAP